MQTNCEKMRTWSQLGAQDEKGRWPPMALGGTCGPLSVGPSAQTSKKVGSNHAGGGTPAHCLRSARPAEAATNFERPFTPLPPLRSPRNFGNARFRRFANFDFSAPNFFLEKFSEKFSDFFSFFIIFGRFSRS